MKFNDLASPHITRRDIDYVCDHDTGKLWILHGKPLPEQKSLNSVELNRMTGIITFHSQAGHAYPIDIPVQEPLCSTFAAGNSVTVVWTQNGDIHDLHVLPLKCT